VSPAALRKDSPEARGTVLQLSFGLSQRSNVRVFGYREGFRPRGERFGGGSGRGVSL